jgi:hypothetical protein
VLAPERMYCWVSFVAYLATLSAARDYRALNSSCLLRTWKVCGSGLGPIRALPSHLPGWTEKNHEKTYHKTCSPRLASNWTPPIYRSTAWLLHWLAGPNTCHTRPHNVLERDSVPKHCVFLYLEFRTMGKVQKPNDSEFKDLLFFRQSSSTLCHFPLDTFVAD